MNKMNKEKKRKLKKVIIEVLSEVMTPPDDEEIQQAYGTAAGYSDSREDPHDVGQAMLKAMSNTYERSVEMRKVRRYHHIALSEEKLAELKELISKLESKLSSSEHDELWNFVFIEGPTRYFKIIGR